MLHVKSAPICYDVHTYDLVWENKMETNLARINSYSGEMAIKFFLKHTSLNVGYFISKTHTALIEYFWIFCKYMIKLCVSYSGGNVGTSLLVAAISDLKNGCQ